jgi:hypothetical protein
MQVQRWLKWEKRPSPVRDDSEIRNEALQKVADKENSDDNPPARGRGRTAHG